MWVPRERRGDRRKEREAARGEKRWSIRERETMRVGERG